MRTGPLARHMLPMLVVLLGIFIGWAIDELTAGVMTGGIAGIAAALWLAQREREALEQAKSLLSTVGPERGRSGSSGSSPANVDDLSRSIRRFLDLERERQEAEQSEVTRQIQLLDHMNDGIMRVDEDGIVVYANLAAGTMFGDRSPLGRSFIAVVRDHELDSLLRRCFKTGEEFQRTIDIPGEGRVINAVVVRMNGDHPEALVVLRDVTELTRLQTLRRDFVANVSHELRTPLSTIKILTETLLDMVGDREEEHRFLTKIDHEVDSMTDLVNDLMQLARLESNRSDLALGEVDVSAVLGDVRDRMLPIAERQGVEIHHRVIGDNRLMVADGRRLRQALINLVHNAVMHTPADGEIRIECDAESDEITFRVVDTGMGIAREDLERIWERFYKADRSRAAPGTGLGLAIVKHIAQAHGGRVAARSEYGEGSEFEITIPRWQRADRRLIRARNARRALH